MQRSLLLSLALPAAVFLPHAPGRGAAELAFAPKEGLVLEKRGQFEAAMELEQLKLTINGEDVPFEAPEARNVFHGVTVATDTYAKVADGRVQRLERSFDELDQSMSTTSPEGETEEDKESPLKGATVVFAWSEEDEEYTASFGEGSGEGLDTELLADLEESLDFEMLLPEKEVEEGDEWTLQSEPLRDLLALGGDFHFDDEDESPQDELNGRALEDELEGTATCTYRGTREVDGRALSVIAIVLSGTGTAEEDSEQEAGPITVDVHARADAEMALEGELLWDAAAGHFAHLALKGTVEFTLTETSSFEAEGESQERESAVTFAGTLSIDFAAAAP
jgi:hypothetical protein